MHFLKMEGLSNDFIVTDQLTEESLDNIISKIPKLCDRRRGIGADGLVVVLPSKIADFKMRIINSDGSEAEMCGNGVRCLASYLDRYNLTNSKKNFIETLAGIIVTEKIENNIRVDMGAPVIDSKKIPTLQTSGNVIEHSLDVDGEKVSITAVSMGNPHAVIFSDKITDELVLGLGPKIESHKFFPKRTNVEFLQVVNYNEAFMRVYERGCGETMACGTGTCASVVAGVINKKLGKKVTVHLLGGDLHIEWDGDLSHSVFMTGPANAVFEGSINI